MVIMEEPNNVYRNEEENSIPEKAFKNQEVQSISSHK